MSEEIRHDALNPSEHEKKSGQVPSPKPQKDDDDAELERVAKEKAAETKNEDG